MKTSLFYILMITLLCSFISCSKCEEPQEQEFISWKTGIFDNRISGTATLAISFSHPYHEVEEIYFESIWNYTISGTTYQIKLTHRDFIWKEREGKLEGEYHHSFKTPPSRISLSWISGRGKLNNNQHAPIRRTRGNKKLTVSSQFFLFF